MNELGKLPPLSRSDALPGFRRLLVHLPAFHEAFGDLVQFRLVIDASVVQKELRWRVASRRDPAARSGLHEAIDSGTILAFAPFALIQEIDEHVDEIAQDAKVPVSRVQEEWLIFRSRLNFYEPDPAPEPGLKCVDPDDLPYKAVRDQLGAQAVYTRDLHFHAMQVPAITVDLDVTMRDYARGRSIQVAVNLGSGLGLMLSLQVVVAMVKGVSEFFRRLPTGAKVILGIAIFVALLNPKSRDQIAKILRSVWDQLNEIKSPLAAMLASVGNQYVAAQERADESLADIQSHVPVTGRRSALVRARAICLISKEPLSIVEIEFRMRSEGYVSKSRNCCAYLRRVLRRDRRFVEVSKGFWTLQAQRIG